MDLLGTQSALLKGDVDTAVVSMATSPSALYVVTRNEVFVSVTELKGQVHTSDCYPADHMPARDFLGTLNAMKYVLT